MLTAGLNEVCHFLPYCDDDIQLANAGTVVGMCQVERKLNNIRAIKKVNNLIMCREDVVSTDASDVNVQNLNRASSVDM
jgi:hypothetical protein